MGQTTDRSPLKRSPCEKSKVLLFWQLMQLVNSVTLFFYWLWSCVNEWIPIIMIIIMGDFNGFLAEGFHTGKWCQLGSTALSVYHKEYRIYSVYKGHHEIWSAPTDSESHDRGYVYEAGRRAARHSVTVWLIGQNEWPTVHSESIQTPWIFPHFVTLQPYSEMDSIVDFFPSSIYARYPIMIKQKQFTIFF